MTPLAISLGTKIRGKLTDFEVVGHFTRKISTVLCLIVGGGGSNKMHQGEIIKISYNVCV